MEEKNCSQDISKYINPEELPSFIPQQLKDLIENNIDAFTTFWEFINNSSTTWAAVSASSHISYCL